MSLPAEIQVLVVGAGPTGLASAIALADLGLQVVVVDAALTNPVGSRASVVHSHTLEVLDTIGLAEPLIQAGNQSKGIRLCGKAEKLMEFDVSQLRDETKFPMSVNIPQEDVERIFRDKLESEGIKLFRNKRVVGMGHSVVSPGVEVKFEDGSVVLAQYIVGADGARSTIRRLSGIEFKDPTTGVGYTNDVALSSVRIVFADVYLEEPLPPCLSRDILSVYLDDFLLLVPFRSQTPPSQTHSSSYWRLGFRVPAGGDAPHNPSLEDVQKRLDASNPWGVKVTVSSVAASSRYRVRSAVASTYYRKVGDGHVVLAGDAAHVHSPAGGQGMNLGICDAIASAHAIHSHHKMKAAEDGEGVLQHYAESRRKTGVRVIGLTSNLTTLMNAGVGWRRWVRNVVFLVARHLPYVGRVAALNISGLSNRME